MFKLILNVLLISFVSCAGIKPIKNSSANRNVAEKVDTSKFYDPAYLVKLNSAKEKYRKGKHDQALVDLQNINDNNLKPTEKASKHNLIGVIYFSKKRNEEAAKEFEFAAKNSKEDGFLEAQIYFNLGSLYFKNTQYEKSLQALNQVDFTQLKESEAKKYHQIHAILNEQLGKKDQSLASLIRSLGDKKTIEDLRSDSKYANLEIKYFNLSESERVRLLENFDEEKNIVIPSLALKEIDLALKNQDKDKVKDFSNWLTKRYADNQAVMSLLAQKSNLVSNIDQRVNANMIGVVLPLSGDKKSLGERALNGIDLAILELNEGSNNKFQIEVKDNQSQGADATFAVSELIEKSNVMAVIGGLSSNTAAKEYLEAKKRGVLFISLSPVLLPKEEKNHLLIEIAGSVESQINQVFSDRFLNKFGKRPAIIYPRNEQGEAYVNEFWRKAKLLNLDVTGIVSYDKNTTDFKDPVKNLLGIKYPREREEEIGLVSEIAKLEQNKNIKRLQNLQPQIDFDWIFVPGGPREVVQILPNFNFYDAFNLNYIGVPSWRSELMSNEGYRYGNVYFLDEALSENETLFVQNFTKKYNRSPKLVETFAYDSLKIISNLAQNNSLDTRSSVENSILKLKEFKGESGNWKFDDGIWLKGMNSFKIKREGIDNI